MEKIDINKNVRFRLRRNSTKNNTIKKICPKLPLLAHNKTYGTEKFEDESNRSNKYSKIITFTSPGNRASDSISLLQLNLLSSLLAAHFSLLASFGLLLACLFLMNNYLHYNYVPMQLFEAAISVLVFIRINNILFQMIWILFQIKQDFIFIRSKRNCMRFMQRMHFGNRMILCFLRFLKSKKSIFL